jgi:Rrf2 family protein
MTKKSGYGLIALSHLAKLPDSELASARRIAREYAIPEALLMNVMKKLSSVGYLESVRGARGGYRLSRPASDLSIIDILESLEGPLRLAECMTEDDTADLSRCKMASQCPIARPIHRLNSQMREYLGAMTLADLVAEQADPVA